MPIPGASRPVSPPHLVAALVVGLLLLGCLSQGADAAGPSPSRFFPARGLTSYLEYDGLAAHDSAWKASAAHAILAGPTAGATLDVERRVMDQLFKAVTLNKQSGADFVAAQDHLARLGFAVATYEADGESSTVIVLNGFGDKAVRDRFGRMLRSWFPLDQDRFPPPARVRGRELYSFGSRNEAEKPFNGLPTVAQFMKATNAPPTGLTWWLEGDALILVNGPTLGPFDVLFNPERAKKDLRSMHKARVSTVLDAIESKRPNAATHPAYLAAIAEGRDLPGFEPSGLFFAEAKKDHGVLDDLGRSLGVSPGENGGSDEFVLFTAADLGRANRIIGRWGFRGKALLTDVRFEVPTPWKGLLGVIDRRGFSRDRLPPIPRASGAFAIGAFDRTKDLDGVASIRGVLKPEALAFLEAVEEAKDEAAPQALREALIRRLGPTWTIYATHGRGTEAVPAFLVGFDDAEGVNKALGALATTINDYFRKRLGNNGNAIAIERLPAPDRGYRLVSPAGVVPWMTDDLQPTVLIGKSSLAVAANPALARAAIAAESRPETRWEPTGELAKSLGCLPANVSFLSVGNPRDSFWPEAIASLPSMAGPFFGKFLGMDLIAEPPSPDLLDVLGVPRGEGNRLAPPKADDLRRLIFPSVLAATVEEQSFRVIALEALPLSCLGFGVRYEPSGKMMIDLKFAPGR